jgi:uncharacterized protein RhaS with RHS repeats
MQARYYDPAIGRFLSIDPIGFSPARPDMFNRYAYAANDPVNKIDPDGQAAIVAAGACGPGAALCGAGIVVVSCAASEGCRGAVSSAAQATGNAIAGAAGSVANGINDLFSPSDNQNEGLTDGIPLSGDDLIFDDKISDQLGVRGWTEDSVKDLIDSTDSTGTTTDNRGGRSDPASVYGTPTGGHVVVNDKTGEIVQVSDKNDDNWKPDDRIDWKEK